jgi:hypothetical protein
MPIAEAKTVGRKKPNLISTKTPSGATVQTPAKGKAKQVDLPGMEDRDIPEIEEAAERYRDVRDDRIALSKDESTAKQALIAVMKAHKRSVYSRNGMSITLEEIDNVKVKTAKKDDEEEE